MNKSEIQRNEATPLQQNSQNQSYQISKMLKSLSTNRSKEMMKKEKDQTSSNPLLANQSFFRPFTRNSQRRDTSLENIFSFQSAAKTSFNFNSRQNSQPSAGFQSHGMSGKNSIFRKNEKTQEIYQKARSQSRPMQGAYILHDWKLSTGKREGSLSSMLKTQQCFKSDHLDQIRKVQIAQKASKVRRILRNKPLDTFQTFANSRQNTLDSHNKEGRESPSGQFKITSLFPKSETPSFRPSTSTHDIYYMSRREIKKRQGKQSLKRVGGTIEKHPDSPFEFSPPRISPRQTQSPDKSDLPDKIQTETPFRFQRRTPVHFWKKKNQNRLMGMKLKNQDLRRELASELSEKRRVSSPNTALSKKNYYFPQPPFLRFKSGAGFRNKGSFPGGREIRRGESPRYKKEDSNRVDHQKIERQISLTPVEGVKINGVIKVPRAEEEQKELVEAGETKRECIMPLFRVSVKGSTESNSDL